jgi:hypothetical protein
MTVVKNLIYDSVLNIDEDSKVPLATEFNSSDIYSPISADYTERIFIYKYFGTGDIMAGIGGIMGFIGPILANLNPYFVMYFLYKLSKAIWTRYEQTYHRQTVYFLEYSKQQLEKKASPEDKKSQDYIDCMKKIDSYLMFEAREEEKVRDEQFEDEEESDKEIEEERIDEKATKDFEEVTNMISKLLQQIES